MSLRILFLCTGNRARSQLAEGLARRLAGPAVEVASAGTRPNPKGVHPVVLEVLAERGIDATQQRPKSLEELPAVPRAPRATALGPRRSGSRR